MEPFNVSKETALPVDFQRPGIPYTANVLQPLVFKHGDDYCCVLGGDPQSGVVGYGRTVEQALQNWDQLLADRIKIAGDDDPLVAYVKETLRAQGANENADANRSKVERAKTAAVTNVVAGGDRQLDNPAEDIPSRRNTTDQSNADGSEYR